MQTTTKKLKISGLYFKIKSIYNDFGSNVFAQCDHNNLEITLNTRFPKQVQESALIHEIIEALNFLHELNLPHPTIQTLEQGLYQVLKDNNLIDFSKYIKE